MSDQGYIILRVIINCFIFAFFLFVPLKTRFRYNYFKTAMLTLLLSLITVVITLLFLTSGQLLAHYSNFGILLWILSAMLIFRITIKGSSFELLFIVLVVLNLYVNVGAIVKVILTHWIPNLSFEAAQTLVTTGLLILYLPLLWLLMMKLYKQVIEFEINLSVWKVIWIIPALTYLMFFVKIVSDYWKNPINVGVSDVVFIVLWSIVSYVFFYVTLQMLVQTYRGITAREQTYLITSQLNMQEEQYAKMLYHIEDTARIRHDLRHHLLSINGFLEAGNIEELREYLKELTPAYITEEEIPICSNHTIDVILRHYAATAQEYGVNMKIEANVPQTISISNTDLCVIFGNLLENAVEACAKQVSKEKTIKIKAIMQEKQLILMVKNTYEEEIKFKDDIYYSTKHEGAGIGLASVKKIVEKNNGFMKIEDVGKYFKVYVLLND